MSQHHREDENAGAADITKKNYIIGFILATVLTIISFGFVALNESISRNTIFTVLIIAAVLQMCVHLYYFLHLNKSSEQRWNAFAFAFALLWIIIFAGGTIVVMYTLNMRMM